MLVIALPLFFRTMLNVNHEGCVNTLQFECTEFYAVHGQDTRNGSSPARWHSSVNLSLQYHQNFYNSMFFDVTIITILQVPLLLLAAQPWIRGAPL